MKNKEIVEHPLNRHLFIADNLNLLRALDNESIDLICIDPPFDKNETFIGNLRPPLSAEERQREQDTLAGWGIYNQRDAERSGIDWPDADNTSRFNDIWRWESDVHEDWVTRIEGDYPALAKVIDTARTAHGEERAAYLTYMAIRLIEMHRILKPTGSLYFHCDHAANSYIRMTLDTIFGVDNFQNTITWRRTYAHNDPRRCGRISDTILLYTKSNQYTWNVQHTDYSENYISDYYRQSDERGRFQAITLTGPGTSRGESGGRWRGYSPTDSGRTWSIPQRIVNRLAGEEAENLSIAERLDLLDEHGYIHWPSSANVPRVKQYLDEMPGVPLQDAWTDIGPLSSRANERTGYPTQKPVVLAERMVKASSNPGDVVLDCFAGCAYVPVAAERNGRQWIACDISPRALTVLRRQFAKFNYAVDGEQQTEHPSLIIAANITTRGPGELPERTDEDPVERQDIKELPERKFKVPASIIPESEMLQRLLELSSYKAWCCGYANRMPDGTVIRTTRNFHLDHIDPKSKDGSNDIQNRAPLCPYHNTRKNNRRVHLADYRTEIADAGEMMVNTTSELITLAEAHHEAMQMYGRAYAARYPLFSTGD